MSVMCKMNGQCCAKKGLCIHEKMIMGIMAIAVIAAAGHWIFAWF